MANREQRGNREKKKPKAAKQNAPSAQTSPFARGATGGDLKSKVTKKDR
jgi:hypothetical protein